MRKYKIWAILPALVLLLLTLTGCEELSARQGCRSTVQALESACHEMDLEGIMACYDNTLVSVATSSAQLLGKVFQVEPEQVLEVCSQVLFGFDYSRERLSTLSYDVHSVEVFEDGTALVQATESYTLDGKTHSADVEIRLALSGDVWLINQIG